MWRNQVGARHFAKSFSSKAKDSNGQVRVPHHRLAFCLVKLMVAAVRVASGQVPMMLCCMSVKHGTMISHIRMLRKEYHGMTKHTRHVPSITS